jgi:hypothetical protein
LSEQKQMEDWEKRLREACFAVPKGVEYVLLLSESATAPGRSKLLTRCSREKVKKVLKSALDSTEDPLTTYTNI